MSIKDKFLSAVNRYNMLPKGTTVAVGVSGGADSMALLRLLYLYRDELGITVRVCHINHGIRGDEADADEQLVKDECKKLGLDFFVKHADIPAISRLTGEGEEECGRRIRYEFFEEVLKDVPENSRIATAHTLSDRAETLLFNLTRGCTVNGLCSIPPVRGSIIRPLYDCRRDEIEEFCLSQDIVFATDSTNSDDSYSRNRIRLNVIPQLSMINPSFLLSAERLMTSAQSDCDYLDRAAEEIVSSTKIDNNSYDIKPLQQLHDAILSRFVMIAARLAGTGVSYEHVKALCADIRKGHGRQSLPSAVTAEISCGKLVFYSKDELNDMFNDSAEEFCIPLAEGCFFTPAGTIKIKKQPLEKYLDQKGCGKINNLLLYNLIGCDTITHNPVIRSRRQSDRITIYNRRVSKSLKKLFNEQKIPPADRNRQVVIADDSGILWVQSCGPDAHAVPTEKTKDIFEITVVTENE